MMCYCRAFIAEVIIRDSRRIFQQDPSMAVLAGAEDCQDSDAINHTKDTHGEHRILRLMAQGILPAVDNAAIQKAKSYADTAKKNSSSALRGVTRHSTTGKWEAHLWDGNYVRPLKGKAAGARSRGRQVYLGGWPYEPLAAMAYDLGAIWYWGRKAQLNFGHERYADDVEELEGMTQDVLVKTLKSISTLFARSSHRMLRYRGIQKTGKVNKSDLRSKSQPNVTQKRGRKRKLDQRPPLGDNDPLLAHIAVSGASATTRAEEVTLDDDFLQTSSYTAQDALHFQGVTPSPANAHAWHTEPGWSSLHRSTLPFSGPALPAPHLPTGHDVPSLLTHSASMSFMPSPPPIGIPRHLSAPALFGDSENAMRQYQSRKVIGDGSPPQLQCWPGSATDTTTGIEVDPFTEEPLKTNRNMAVLKIQVADPSLTGQKLCTDETTSPVDASSLKESPSCPRFESCEVIDDDAGDFFSELDGILEFAAESDDGVEMVDNKLFGDFCEEFLLGCRPPKEKSEA